MLGLYLHIPFCSSICSYCNFNRGLLDPGLKTRYVAALEREIRAASPSPGATRAADTIFFGGGTPSLLEPAEIERLILACRDTFAMAADTEITLETNPETATPDRLDRFLAAGVNRISFGVQSFDDEELVRLGRVQSAARAREAIRAARAAGFANLSFDLMLWLPGQSFASWLRTVDEAVALAPDHLSLYLLELYPNAPLKEAMAREPWAQAPDDEAADMYLAGLDRLDAAGLEQYEILERRPVRLSEPAQRQVLAERRLVGIRMRRAFHRGRPTVNLAAVQDYTERIDAGHEVTMDRRRLSETDRAGEALFTGLRLTAGIDREAFAVRHGADPWVTYGDQLAPFVEAGYVWQRAGRLGLSRQGMLMANEIFITFV